MGGPHKDNPVTFRPTRENRAWLAAQRQAGHAASAVINAALAAYRRDHERPQDSGEHYDWFGKEAR